ncbi:germ cell nuclear acidic protein [Vicugna pacos]|uniref:Germ cell nuclear acidic protein n=1 Tax=Vicugna pacos TaxID=30538 RepID=A0A6J0B3D8_VICPA|nr:acidic repeat-containing protein [Vicugna pacos]
MYRFSLEKRARSRKRGFPGEREYVSYDLPPSPGSIKGRAPGRLPQSLGTSHALDSQSEASSRSARPEAAEADTDMSEVKAGRLKILDDDCYIITVDSSSDEEPDTIAIGMNVQKGDVSYVVIDSDSDDECFRKKKKVKLSGINNKDEILEVWSDTEEKPCQKLPTIIIDDDDDDDLEGPVIIEDDSCDEGQTPSNEQKKDEIAIFQRKVSNKVGHQNLKKDPYQPPIDDPDVELALSISKLSTDEKPEPVVEQPMKRKNKSKNISVKPVVEGRKTRGSSKKKPSAAKSEKCNPGASECKIPGCFLRGLENLKEYSGKKFKRNKDELVQRIYALLNSSVFDKKLPEKIDIGWNKKMLRTAGLCNTGQIRRPKRQRYAKIEISLKVCDSADRLRDTLIHEICHAASWLLDGIRDSHGDAWKYYARKSNMVHPELPKVTRCHNYEINYKIVYECTKCKSRIGRYTRSLNTDRFICAQCRGPLVMLPQTRKDGTPIRPHVRPFAKYVKENYRIIQRQTEGISHGDVMRKLSKDFAAKKKMLGL